MKLWQIIVSFQDILVSPLGWRQICGSRKKGQIEIATVVTLCEGAHQCCEQTTVLSTFLHRKKTEQIYTHCQKKMQIAQISNQKIVTVVTLELSVKEPICAVCISIWNIWIWIEFFPFNGPYQPIVQQINLIKANLSQVHLTSDVFFSGIPFSTLEKKMHGKTSTCISSHTACAEKGNPCFGKQTKNCLETLVLTLLANPVLIFLANLILTYLANLDIC